MLWWVVIDRINFVFIESRKILLFVGFSSAFIHERDFDSDRIDAAKFYDLKILLMTLNFYEKILRDILARVK